MTIISLVRWMRQLDSQLRILGRALLPAVALVLTAVELGGSARAAEVQVIFPEPPTTGQAASNTLGVRRDLVTNYIACGQEFAFRDRLGKIAGAPGEIPEIVGKMLWLLLNPVTPGGKPEPMPSGGPVVKYRDDPHDAEIYQMDLDVLPLTRIQMTTPFEFPGRDCESAAEIPLNIDDDTKQRPQALDDWIASQNSEFAKVMPRECGPFLVRDKDERGAPANTAKVVVTPPCMRSQINLFLSRMQVKGQPGSSSLPCHIDAAIFGGKKTDGEWDVVVREVTRVLFLHSRNSQRQILDQSVVDHISNELQTLDGPPGPTSYSFFECGNQEQSTGTPRDRADEHSWLDDTLDSIGDIFDWLWKRLALLVVVLAALGLLAALLQGLVSGALGVIAAGVAAAIGTMIAFGRVPETENHLLNIETSRYLKNQEIIRSLKDSGDDSGQYELYQAFVKDFLMLKFQDLLKNDFREFNARPYSRYSLLAVQNIAQFADDPELSKAARMVLQFSMAKAAIGSNRGRRIVPYRRHMEALRSRGFMWLFQNVNDGDHLIPMMMFFTGQTQHLPNNAVQRASLDQMIYYASGMVGPEPIIPDDRIMEAAVEKTRRYEQRIAHAGAEIYSGGDGWLVTAGGVKTVAVNSFIAPVDLGVKKLYVDDDRGAAWPTTLMLAAASVRPFSPRWWEPVEDVRPMEDFIRIEGLKILFEEETEQAARDKILGNTDFNFESIVSIRRERGFWRGEAIKKDTKQKVSFGGEAADSDRSVETFEGNLCVGEGVACGFNVELPPPFDGSVMGCGDVRGGWTFFDTDRCYPDTARRPDVPDRSRRPGATRVFIAVFRAKCPLSASGKCRNWGVLEVISFDDPALAKFAPDQRYANFMQLVSSENQSLDPSAGSVLSSIDVEAHGTYRAVKQNGRGERISIRYEAEISESSSIARIVSIDGVERKSHESWKLAEGDFINVDSNDRVVIGWRGDPRPPLILDLSNYVPLAQQAQMRP